MRLSNLVCLASLKSSQSEMISRYLRTNDESISTFVIVTKKQLLESDLTSASPKTFVQGGRKIEQRKINPSKFFFALMRGCGTEKIIILPNPAEFE